MLEDLRNPIGCRTGVPLSDETAEAAWRPEVDEPTAPLDLHPCDAEESLADLKAKRGGGPLMAEGDITTQVGVTFACHAGNLGLFARAPQ